MYVSGYGLKKMRVGRSGFFYFFYLVRKCSELFDVGTHFISHVLNNLNKSYAQNNSRYYR